MKDSCIKTVDAFRWGKNGLKLFRNVDTIYLAHLML